MSVYSTFRFRKVVQTWRQWVNNILLETQLITHWAGKSWKPGSYGKHRKAIHHYLVDSLPQMPISLSFFSEISNPFHSCCFIKSMEFIGTPNVATSIIYSHKFPILGFLIGVLTRWGPSFQVGLEIRWHPAIYPINPNVNPNVNARQLCQVNSPVKIHHL